MREGQHFASGGKLEIRVDQTGIQKQIKHHDCRFVLGAGHTKDDTKERERVGQSHSRVCLLLYSFQKCIVSQSLYIQAKAQESGLTGVLPKSTNVRAPMTRKGTVLPTKVYIKPPYG